VRQHHDLTHVVEFICRNSLSSPTRSDLLKQVIRAYVAKKYVDRLMTSTVRDEIATTVRSLISQFTLRGFL